MTTFLYENMMALFPSSLYEGCKLSKYSVFGFFSEAEVILIEMR